MKEFILTAMDCGLETAAQHKLLLALGQIADRDTGHARVSLIGLAHAARLDERSVRRALRRLTDMDRKARQQDGVRNGLVITVQEPPRGPRSAGVWRVHWERLETVADAYRIARRQIGAGAAFALREAQLDGAPGTVQNASKAIAILQAALAAEGYASAARQVAGQMDGLMAAMDGWPDRVRSVTAGVTEAVDNDGGVSDILSGVSDILSATPTPPYKDNTPQGNQEGVRAAREVAGERSAGRFGEGERVEGIQIISAQRIAAELAMNANQRGRIMEALLGAQIFECDGCLTIRAPSAAHQARLLDLLSEPLADLCMSHGRWANYTISDRRAS